MFLAFNRLLNEINGASRILFVCHKNPDPDTVGGALALGAYAESLGKRTACFCADKIPENFLFLKGAEKFSSDFGIFSGTPPHQLNKKSWCGGTHDLVIFVDCAELSRSGLENKHQNPAPKPEENFSKNQLDLTETPSAHRVLGQYLSRGLVRGRQNWISIDHHPSREKFADFEIRGAGASSTCEIIYNFFLHAGAEIDNRMATALLSGLMIDTSFLSNAATNEDSIRAAADLVFLGADYKDIVRAFYLNKCDDTLKLWGLALSRLKHNKEKNVVSTAIFNDDLGGDKNIDEITSGLSSFINRILKSNMVVVLQEAKDGVRGSLRSNDDGADVAEIAAEYGGGGHRRAAGFSCKGKIVERENEWGIDKI